MPLTTATVTYDFSDLVGADFKTSQVEIWATTNIPDQTVIDTDGNKTRLGTGKGAIGADGTGSITVWVPGAGSNPASWQTTIHVKYPDRHQTGHKGHKAFGPYTITAGGDVADLETQQAVPPTYITQVTEQLDTYATAAATSADEAATSAALARDISEIDTSDDAIDAALQLPGGKAAARLSATVAAEATPLIEDAAYATPAVQAFLQKVKQEQQDAYWTHVGDSIDASNALWVARLADHLAAQFPTHTVKFRIWSSSTNAWLGWETRSTGSGARTIWVSNGAVGGTTTAYAASRIVPMVWGTTPDLLTYAYNANEFPHTASGAVTYVGRFLAFTEDALRGCNAQIVYVAKPPRPADPGGVEYRVDAAREAVRAKGFGFIDFMQPFRDTPNYATALYLPESTVVHPNTAGQDLMVSIAEKHFTYRPGVNGGAQSPSSLTPPLGNILPNGFFTDWTGADPATWVFNTNATCTKDTANFETGTYGLRITPTVGTTATAKIEADVDVTRYRGQYLTLAARVLAPWTNANAAGLGRLGIASSGVGYTQGGSSEVWSGAGFQWRAVSLRIPDAATTARIVLEARATFTGSTDWAVYDRVILAPGVLPRDAMPGLVI